MYIDIFDRSRNILVSSLDLMPDERSEKVENFQQIISSIPLIKFSKDDTPRDSYDLSIIVPDGQYEIATYPFQLKKDLSTVKAKAKNCFPLEEMQLEHFLDLLTVFVATIRTYGGRKNVWLNVR